MFGGIMRKKRYRSYHIIIIPYDKVSSRNIYLPTRTLKLMTGIAVVVIGLIATFATMHTRNYYEIRTALYPTLKQNAALARDNAEMKDGTEELQSVIDSLTNQLHGERAVHRERLKALNAQAAKVKKFAENLRIMAGFKLDAKHAQPPGLGGPIPEEMDGLLLTEDIENIGILKEFGNAENRISKDFSTAQKAISSLWEYFEGKNSVIEGTPELKPVPGAILSGFGYRIGPFTGREEFHQGVDIPAPIGTKIKAPADGVVIFAGRMGGYGKLLVIDHGNSYKTVYGHLHAFDVEVGDRVRKGDYIGEVGNTGRSTGPHLHYEVKLNDVAVNPVNYFRSVDERKKEYEEIEKPDSSTEDHQEVKQPDGKQ
jgi:murein DD-endopeptidase MepM/ murein hydrolase activator NlpD